MLSPHHNTKLRHRLTFFSCRPFWLCYYLAWRHKGASGGGLAWTHLAALIRSEIAQRRQRPGLKCLVKEPVVKYPWDDVRTRFEQDQRVPSSLFQQQIHTTRNLSSIALCLHSHKEIMKWGVTGKDHNSDGVFYLFHSFRQQLLQECPPPPPAF